ncbi:murein L,D-transpeptidase catalytic domain-containing protein [Hymenobacter terrestris]|uniref:Murein L,D-transpeptidase catalytic domain family protein n=1 Tax=Hymenobacter terrestris TaxID=2748310 RepID=A0ABX2Q208_9BACT|nr:murein L,D-transpeptidase catalytic domain family protein [Hymenobacter terrestris]NVO84995.1 murein L,D-transpeptidase catalytic domain family protein [Hymenobacter terrestris]
MLRLLSFFALLLSACQSPSASQQSEPPISAYIQQLRADIKAAGGAYNQRLACYVDLTRPDTQYRFFLLDLQQERVVHQGLALNGLTDKLGNVRYSNELNSNCSSRGLARIGEKYHGRFGRAFRLDGLEASTRNLRKRAVVLHSWSGVDAWPTEQHPIQSEGCPALNPLVLDSVATVIESSAKPLLIRLN